MSDLVAVLALSLASSCLVEAVSYAMVYRTDEFKDIKARIARCEAKLDEERSALTGRGKNRQRRIEGLEAQLAAARTRASSMQMRNTFAAGAVQIAAIYLVGGWFGGRVVLVLPFGLPRVLRVLSQRGLPNDSSPAACSATFVFILGGMLFRAALDRWLKLGLPRSSSSSSLPPWLANVEAAAKKR
ncbi:hypothetical protein H4R18_001145 [Coemansia javaensis]|uniref:Guided entry of tail-anchored proteins 1 n=1 Tax=Coemansia javaensis TaxID=2761396 RepID=A0A9W8LM20_9FUNG|nr:hypothetical protein H4R18_001145 [Coemansia javaensis]